MKKKVLVVSIILMIFVSSFVYSDDEQEKNEALILVDKILAAWDGYVKNPTEPMAQKLYDILPSSWTWWYGNEPDVEHLIFEKLKPIVSNFNFVLDQAREKDKYAIQLAFKIAHIFLNRNEYSFFPVLDELISKDPEFALLSLQNHLSLKKEIDEEDCKNWLSYVDDETHENADNSIKVIQNKINSLKSVQTEKLLTFRDKCIKGLEKEIEYYKNRGDLPESLEDCYRLLIDMTKDNDLEEVMALSEDKMTASCHIGIGQWIRNNWGLWSGRSKIAKYFHGLGIYHADDMSGIILGTFWCHYNNKPLRLDSRIEYYKKYWKVHAAPSKDTFPTKNLEELGGNNYKTHEGELLGYIHVYKDIKTGKLWLYEYNTGWRKADKVFFKKHPSWKEKEGISK